MARDFTNGEKKAEAKPICPLCWSKNQFERHKHFLCIGEESELAGHLKEQYGEPERKFGEPEKETPGLSGILNWVKTMQSLYSDYVDESGVKLPVWKAWAIAHSAPDLTAIKTQYGLAPPTPRGRMIAAQVMDSLKSKSRIPLDRVVHAFSHALIRAEERADTKEAYEHMVVEAA